MAVPIVGGDFLSQESPFNPEKFIPGQLISNVQSYPRVEDNSPMPPLKSISPIVIDPPTLSPLPPPNERFPIVGRVLTFGEMEGIHDQQTSGYPRVEDTSTVDHRPNNDTTMEGVVEIFGVATSDDHVDIEFALRNANLDGCKEALPASRSSDDDEDDGGHEKQSDVRLSDHLNIIGVNSSEASRDCDSTPPECSRQGGQEAHAEEKGCMTPERCGLRNGCL
jgi:hypothetical protein